MKKKITLLFLFLVLFTLTSCKKKDDDKFINENRGRNMLVLYFSATGNTKTVASKLSNVLKSDIVEIIPEILYTSNDLNYNDDNSRANKEQNDKNARPKIKNEIDISNYDTIFIGYPIWWGTVPKIILTLLDNVNLDGKNIVLFCTSGSTGIDGSLNDLKQYKDDINIIGGKRFNANVTNDEINAWINSLNINIGVKNMYIKINDKVLTVDLVDNSSSRALVDKLKQGDITLNMSDYGNFEKVSKLGFTLPTNDEEITTVPGDVILYQGNSITIYYDQNTWNFTRLGRIQDVSQSELKSILGTKDVTVTFSLNK